jgi:hypothetical protein
MIGEQGQIHLWIALKAHHRSAFDSDHGHLLPAPKAQMHERRRRRGQ